jgi:hypothetical protein
MKMVSMVSGLQSDTYEGRLAELGLDSLRDWRHVFDMLLINKMTHGVGDFNMSELFDPVQNFHATRAVADPLNVKPQPANLELRRGFFSYRAGKDWKKTRLMLRTYQLQAASKWRTGD